MKTKKKLVQALGPTKKTHKVRRGRRLRLAKKLRSLALHRDELEASICRDSFYDFVQRMWETVETAKPIWNWHVRAMCDALQEVAERVFKGLPREHNVLINVPPGSTKSLVCSVMFPAWVWTRMAHAQTICASYADDLALDLSVKSRDVVTSEKYRRLFPAVQLRDDQKTKTFFKNVDGGWRYAVGTNGAVTGKHAHFKVIDDPIDPNRAFSKAELAAANRWIAQTLSRRNVDSKITVTILVMQRLHQDDPSGIMLAKAKKRGKLRHLNFPAEVVGSGLGVVRPRKWARYYKPDPHKPGHRLLDAKRVERADLDDALVELGEFGYAGQMLQNPVPSGGGMFKVERIAIEAVGPKPADVRAWVRFWDKAGTKDAGAFTAGVKMCEDVRGRFWVLNVVKGQWEANEREETILQTAQSDGLSTTVGVEQEPGSSGKDAALGTIKKLAGYRVRAVRPTGDKELRADPFAVQANAGNVAVVQGEWVAAYLEELRFFPKGRLKDQVDASSGAFGMLTQHKVRVGGMGYGPKHRALQRAQAQRALGRRGSRPAVR